MLRHKNVILLVGSQGSGKSTIAQTIFSQYYRISQDDMGENLHYIKFIDAVKNGYEDIIVDRINHNIEQRSRYLVPAKENNYKTCILWVDTPFEVCYQRVLGRENHKLKHKNADRAVRFFHSNFEEPTPSEADFVYRLSGVVRENSVGRGFSRASKNSD